MSSKLELINLLSWVEDDHVKQLNKLQQMGLISDNCVTWDDVAEVDAKRILGDWRNLKKEINENKP